MPELPDLPAIDPADVSDDDLLLIYDNSAPSNKARKVTRTQLLRDVVFEDGDHNLGVVEIDDLSATDASLTNATIITGLEFDAASTINSFIAGSVSIITVGTANGAGETLAKTVSGATTAAFLSVAFTAALPDGLSCQAWISATDTVSFRFFNNSGGAVASDTYTARVTIIKAT